MIPYFVNVGIAVLGTGISAYYDIRNNRNIPSVLLYLFLGISAVLAFFTSSEPGLTLATAAVLFLAGYTFYRLGHIGEADVYVISSLALLLPRSPVEPYGYVPFVFTVLVLAGIVFSGYAASVYLPAAMKRKKRLSWRELSAIALLIGLLCVTVYMLNVMGMFTVWYYLIFAYFMALAILFMVYKNEIKQSMMEVIPVSRIEDGDVIAVETLDREYVEKNKIPRVFKQSDLNKLKKAGIRKLPVYTKLPPFLPFVFIGLLISLYTGDLFMHLINIYVYI